MSNLPTQREINSMGVSHHITAIISFQIKLACIPNMIDDPTAMA